MNGNEKTGDESTKEALVAILTWSELSEDQIIDIARCLPTNSDAWDCVRRRLNLHDRELNDCFRIARTANHPEIWHFFMRSKKLTRDQMLKVAREANTQQVWREFAGRFDFSVCTNDELRELGEEANNEDVWCKVIRSLKVPPLEILDIARRVNDYFVWMAALRRLDFSNSSFEEKIEIGKEANESDVWRKILHQGEYSKQQLLQLSTVVPAEVGADIVKKGRNNLSVEELSLVGDRCSCVRTWAAIIDTGRLDGARLLEIGKLFPCAIIWELIGKQAGTASVTNDQWVEIALNVAKHCGAEVVTMLRVIPLRAYSFQTLLYICRRAQSEQAQAECFYEAVVTCCDLTEAELIQLGRQADRISVWVYIISTKQITRAGLLVVIDELQPIHNETLVKAIVATGELGSEELMELAQRACMNDRFPNVWFPVIASGKLDREQLLRVANMGEIYWTSVARQLDLSGQSIQAILELAHSFSSPEAPVAS